MTIIVDNGAYSLRNMGDVAMLQVAIRRVRALCPDPTIYVLTTRPDLLPRYCPNTLPLSVESRDAAYEPFRLGGSSLAERWRRARNRWRGYPEQARAFQFVMESAGVVLLAGGGFLNDLNPTQTRPVLRMLTDAGRRGKRTALFSQGLGPLDSPELVGLLNQACAAGARVGLRESRRGPEILRRASVDVAKFAVTGDDALELGWEAGHASGGNAIGFSIRKVGYSGVEDSDFGLLTGAMKGLAARLQTPLTGLPVSFNSHEADPEAIARVLGGTAMDQPSDSPEALIRAASQCRLVVTGTYHAAVFALAQGTPCVCFYVSPYYRDKLEGLASQFPGGCEIVNLRAPDAGHRIEAAAIRLWEARDSLTSRLRQLAQEQVRAAQRFCRLAVGLSD